MAGEDDAGFGGERIANNRFVGVCRARATQDAFEEKGRSGDSLQSVAPAVEIRVRRAESGGLDTEPHR